MEEEDKEDEEYRKRIKNFIDRVEKGEDDYTNKNGPEMFQLLLEKLEQVKTKAISKIDPDYRNEKFIVIFVYMIRDYYWFRADLKHNTERDQFLDEIDDLYRLIYEEIKKPSPFVSHYTLEERKSVERIQRRRIIGRMTQVLGAHNVSNDFHKKYKVNDLIVKRRKNENFFFVFIIILVIFSVLIFIL